MNQVTATQGLTMQVMPTLFTKSCTVAQVPQKQLHEFEHIRGVVEAVVGVYSQYFHLQTWRKWVMDIDPNLKIEISGSVYFACHLSVMLETSLFIESTTSTLIYRRHLQKLILCVLCNNSLIRR